ncbi:sialin-like isoform X2 [Centruroides sculpturatus]|uniref:sialin-like isoform X1 n=1 Tax=Centruroides sculpturatus TaxID=218467 RepID=UPI000C6ED674|nr:sialin-like isoform X1 [Centruroides sculpturatus]XP_023218033.1 sialin-like isoform X2 [Centruroides sculpturatus]
MIYKVHVSARYVLVFSIFLTYTIMNCQRSVLSVAILAMVNHSAIYSMYNTTSSKECPEKSTHNSASTYKEGSYVWTQPTQGIILGSYFYGLVLAQLVGGTITFLLGPKKIFIISLSLSSLFIILTPLSADVGVLVISLCQAIVGFGQGLVFHGSFTLLGRWSPENEKSTLSSISYSGTQAGTFLGLITTGYLCEHKGWPFSFYAFGICGIIVSLCLMFTIYDRPQEHPRISSKELIFLNESIKNISSGEKKLSIPWKGILTSRIVWILALTKICWGVGYFTILTKFPSYLEIILHFPIKQNGLLNSVVYTLDSLTIFTSGFIADFMKRRNYFSITNIRKIFETVATFGPAACIVAIPVLGCESTTVIICLIIGMGCFGFNNSGDVAIVLDLAPEFAGVIYGLTNGLCNIAGILSPYAAGVILDRNQGYMVQWSYVFYMASFAYFLSGVIFLFGATAELQPWATINTDTEIHNKNLNKNRRVKLFRMITTPFAG